MNIVASALSGLECLYTDAVSKLIKQNAKFNTENTGLRMGGTEH